MPDPDAPRQTVSLSLDAGLVMEAAALTGDLSATVDALLARYVQEARGRQAMNSTALDRTVTALNIHHARHGFLSDEFSAL